jgi:prepilin-type N-terminal cleavage/methylation domain-containing protein
MRRIRTDQSGFTIVELMIATMVFSVILMVIVFGVIHFSNAYYKGINSSLTQTTARNAIDTVSQAIQFGTTTQPSSDDGVTGQFCAGGKVFLYTLGKQLTTTPSVANWGLYRVDSSSGCTLTSGTAGGTELLSNKMRLADLSVSQPDATSNLWSISLRVVFGDDDLLTNPANTDANCKLNTGAQFCSVSALSTTVQQRIVNT